MQPTSQNQFHTSCGGVHNPALVFPTLEQWQDHKDTCRFHPISQNQFNTNCGGIHNPSLVFPTLEQWEKHKRSCKSRNKIRDEEFYKCVECNMSFFSDGECDTHYKTKKHFKQVRKTEIESRPDFKGYPCDCHQKVFETFESMVKHEEWGCALCNKKYAGKTNLKRHLNSKNHADRVRWNFEQTVKIWLGNKAQTWEDKLLEDKNRSNRGCQQRWRDRRKFKNTLKIVQI